MYAATLGQNRFGYYLGLCLALLTGWVCAACSTGRGPRRRPARSRADERRARSPEPRAAAGSRRRGGSARWPRVVVVVYAPSVVIAYPMAMNNLGLSAGYRASLEWLRRNTPEPFGAGDYYYARYRRGRHAPPRLHGDGVVGLRLRDHPARAAGAGRQSHAGRRRHRRALLHGARRGRGGEGSRSDELALRHRHAEVPILPRGGLVQGKFETLAAWAGKDITQFWETFLTKDPKGGLGPLVLFHPDYYRTMAVRLYVFGGRRRCRTTRRTSSRYAERRECRRHDRQGDPRVAAVQDLRRRRRPGSTGSATPAARSSASTPSRRRFRSRR